MNPVCVSTWKEPDGDRHFGSFIASARRVGIEPKNADQNIWPHNEFFRKTAAQAGFARNNINRYTHFLFCDSYDVLFSAGWDEIMPKFDKLKSPIVFGTECHPWPKAEQASLYPSTEHRCKYVNAGFWMGESFAVMSLLNELESTAARREQCDQGIMVDIFLSRSHPIILDTACSLLFCCNLNSLEYLDLTQGRRPTTKDSFEQPCLFHGNGGSDLGRILSSLERTPRYVASQEETERMAQ